MRKIKNPWIGVEKYNCYGCCPDNEMGLKMEFYEDGDDIISFWNPQTHGQGWVGTIHGGILSTLIDEIAGWVVIRKLQTTGMTSKLEVRYKQPVATTEPQLTRRAHIRERRRNLVFIDATIENGQGELCVEGSAVYSVFDEKRAKEMGFRGCELEDEQLLSM